MVVGGDDTLACNLRESGSTLPPPFREGLYVCCTSSPKRCQWLPALTWKGSNDINWQSRKFPTLYASYSAWLWSPAAQSWSKYGTLSSHRRKPQCTGWSYETEQEPDVFTGLPVGCAPHQAPQRETSETRVHVLTQSLSPSSSPPPPHALLLNKCASSARHVP